MSERYRQGVWIDSEINTVKAIPIVGCKFTNEELGRVVNRHMKRSGAGILIFERLPIDGYPTHDAEPLSRTFVTITPYHIEEMRELPIFSRMRVFNKILNEIRQAPRTLLIDLPI